jgi:hypothetical protein
LAGCALTARGSKRNRTEAAEIFRIMERLRKCRQRVACMARGGA